MRHRLLYLLLLAMLAAAADRESGLRAQSVTTMNAQRLDSLLAARDGRPLVLNLWATWCVPCREEFPDLVTVSKEFPGVDVAVLSVDYPDEIDSKIRPFVRELSLPFPVYVSGYEQQEALIDRLARSWNGALPATFLFTTNGVRDTFYVGRQSLEKFRAAFRRVGAMR